MLIALYPQRKAIINPHALEQGTHHPRNDHGNQPANDQH
jgi:hypothetical protein